MFSKVATACISMPHLIHTAAASPLNSLVLIGLPMLSERLLIGYFSAILFYSDKAVESDRQREEGREMKY